MRFFRDWSSAVFSSDLKALVPLNVKALPYLPEVVHVAPLIEIGRASCRERVYTFALAVSLTKEETTSGARVRASLGSGVALGLADGIGVGGVLAASVAF